jgi:hypothetical protein
MLEIARPNMTPASVRIEAGDLVSGGPVRTSSFSQSSGAGRVAVRITGMLATTSSVAT